MQCYQIAYTNRYGRKIATKWGNDPKQALGFLMKAHTVPAEYETPVLVNPQPFTPEYEAQTKSQREDVERRRAEIIGRGMKVAA